MAKFQHKKGYYKKNYNPNTHYLNVESQGTYVFVTFYPEQVIKPEFRKQLFPNSSQDKEQGKQISDPQYWSKPFGKKVVEECRNYLKKMVVRAVGEWEIALICHDKDMTVEKDNKLKAKHKKTHFHAVIWRKDGKRFRVRKVLQILGLNFDAVLDANILDKTFSSISSRNVKNALQYLLHMTEASELDGKEPYNQSELISNLTDEQLDNIFHATVQDKLSNDDWDKLAEMAYQCGKNLHDFRTFTTRHFNIRQQSQAPFKVIKQYYENGLLDAVATAEDFPRINIILRGVKNTGKSYSTQKALNKLHMRVYSAISGSGKYDGLSADDDCLLFDDKNGSQLLSVCSDSPVLLHRRNVGYSPWVGNSVIALTNKSFTHWIKNSSSNEIHTENGEVVEEDRDAYDAMISRFYFCEVVWPDFQPQDFSGQDYSRAAYIKVVKRYDRGSEENKKIHDEMFYQLIKPIEEEIKNYYQIKYYEYWNKYHDEKHQQKVVSTDKNNVQYYFDNRIENIDNQNDTETTENVDKSTTSITNRVKTQPVLDLGKYPIFENKNDDAVGHDANALTPKEIDDLANSFGISK